MLIAAVATLGAAMLIAFADWRRGLYATVFMAFAQDPLRKATEGQPPVYILFAGVVFAAAAAGALAAGVRIGPSALAHYRRDLRLPVALYLAALVLQALQGFLRIGSPAPPLLGLILYLAPLAALGAAVAFARAAGPERLARWLTFYVTLASLYSLSIALQAMGLESSLFGEVGPGIHIFGADGEIAANCGLFRSSEIAGWHAATAGALGIVLVTRRRLDPRRLALALLFAAALGALAALTGRRKAPMLILLFGALYIGLLGHYLRGALRAGVALAALVPVAYLVVSPWLAAADFSGGYGERALSAFAAASDRAFNVAWAPLATVIDVYGPLGGGLGLATQGTQYAGLSGSADATSGAGEGGLGKLAIELGAPGMAAALLLALTLARRIARVLRGLAAAEPAAARLVCGLVALLGANAVNFALAAQTYGDPFVLLFLGLLAGATLAAPGFARSPSPMP